MEFDQSLVTCSEELIVHLNDLGCLANHTAVNDRLVVLLDRGRMMQDNYLSIKVLGALRVCLFVQ
jgi:hypothetical protein